MNTQYKKQPKMNSSASSCHSVKSYCPPTPSGTAIFPCQFPWRLHEVLLETEKQGLAPVVSWLPGNMSFKVHNTEAFANTILPKYFKHTKYRSFTRQLNVWGFERILEGPLQGGYTHACFVRNKPSLCYKMKRERIKGSQTRTPSMVRLRSATPPIQKLVFDLGTEQSSSSFLTTSFPQNCGEVCDPSKNEIPATDQEMRKHILDTFSILSKGDLTFKEKMFSSQDMKYIMIGMKWGTAAGINS